MMGKLPRFFLLYLVSILVGGAVFLLAYQVFRQFDEIKTMNLKILELQTTIQILDSEIQALGSKNLVAESNPKIMTLQGKHKYAECIYSNMRTGAAYGLEELKYSCSEINE